MKDGANMGVRSIHGQRQAVEKAESNVGFYWRDFPEPLRALVRGARTQAAE